jgi:hypothetical protein
MPLKSGDLLLEMVDVFRKLDRRIPKLLIGPAQVCGPRLQALVDWLLGNIHAHPALQQLNDFIANAHKLSSFGRSFTSQAGDAL